MKLLGVVVDGEISGNVKSSWVLRRYCGSSDRRGLGPRDVLA